MATFNIAYKNSHKEDMSFDISYTIENVSHNKNIIFLHGWGSNKEIMQCFAPYFPNAKLIFIDMPGFGNSPNDFILNTYDYANIIDIFLKEKSFKKDVIIGHSFGGKVATLLNPDLLVLLGSSGIVIPKTITIKAKIAISKILKIFNISNFLISSDVKGMPKNMYEVFKIVLNEDFSNEFKNFKKNAYYYGENKTQPPLYGVLKL